MLPRRATTCSKECLWAPSKPYGSSPKSFQVLFYHGGAGGAQRTMIATCKELCQAAGLSAGAHAEAVQAAMDAELAQQAGQKQGAATPAAALHSPWQGAATPDAAISLAGRSNTRCCNLPGRAQQHLLLHSPWQGAATPDAAISLLAGRHPSSTAVPPGSDAPAADAAPQAQLAQALQMPLLKQCRVCRCRSSDAMMDVEPAAAAGAKSLVPSLQQVAELHAAAAGSC